VVDLQLYSHFAFKRKSSLADSICKKKKVKMKLLVIGSQRLNYTELFDGATIDLKSSQESIEVDHCTWDDMSVCSFADQGGLVVTISPSRKPLAGTLQSKSRVFHPDFVLLRAGTRGGARTDHSHKLDALLHSGVPTLNSALSFYVSQNKAIMYRRLLDVKHRLGGADAFPLIAQTAYSDWAAGGFVPEVMPCVAKIGTASGGLGKAKIKDADAWDDFKSVAAMQPQFFASEPFVRWVFDVRVQKIGEHVRAFRRTSKHWKSNADMMMKDEDIDDVPERYRTWVNEACAELGMDISAMDLLVAEDGREFILELNSSAIGLNGRHHAEDAQHIRELTLERMRKHRRRQLRDQRRQIRRRQQQSTQTSQTSHAAASSSSH
jgi:synapsin